jgi:tetratricopeptide (TPR) repeat protein
VVQAMSVFDGIIDKNLKIDEQAREITLKRPASERELARRPDRIKTFLEGHLKAFIFDEFSDEYLEATKLGSLMKGVPIPLRKDDLEAFASTKGLGVHILAENMARVIGVDPKFRHTGTYVAFIERFLGKKGVELIVKEARREAERELYEEACVHYRAALVLRPDDLSALYGYARVCRAMYSLSDDPEYIGKFKAEALDYLELLTGLYPRYGQGWYYLGYMYLNMGLYSKAYMAWERFLPRSRLAKDRREIRMRMEQIQTPMEIERGYTAVMAGRWREGLSILSPFVDSAYKDWWPLWYYLGEAWLHTGKTQKAKDAYIKVLRLNGTHIESMEALMDLYESEGDAEKVEKYRKKIALLAQDVPKN